jgi:hypothetical protein
MISGLALFLADPLHADPSTSRSPSVSAACFWAGVVAGGFFDAKGGDC